MKTVRIAGGRIIDPANKRDEIGDLWIADGPDRRAVGFRRSTRPASR